MEYPGIGLGIYELVCLLITTADALEKSSSVMSTFVGVSCEIESKRSLSCRSIRNHVDV